MNLNNLPRWARAIIRVVVAMLVVIWCLIATSAIVTTFLAIVIYLVSPELFRLLALLPLYWFLIWGYQVSAELWAAPPALSDWQFVLPVIGVLVILIVLWFDNR